MTMRDTLTLLNQVSGITEELGTLGEVPSGWIKLLTGQGAGDQSEIMPIAQNIKSSRQMGSAVKDLADSDKFAGLYLTKEDGTPVGIIKFTGEGGKPWRFITPSGSSATRTQRVTRAIPRWRRRNPQDRWSRETVSYQASDMSLNDLATQIPFADGLKLYGIKKDTHRAQLQQQRRDARAGQGSDIATIKKGAAQKYVAGKVGTSIEDLKAKIQAVAAHVQKKLDKAIAVAASGEYDDDRGDILSKQKIEELNNMLYDLRQLSMRVKELPDKGMKSGYKRGTSREGGGTWRSYDFENFLLDLDRIQGKLARVDQTGRYEAKAKQLVKTVVDNARKK